MNTTNEIVTTAVDNIETASLIVGKVPGKLGGLLARGKFIFGKHSPEILIGVGLVGVVGSAILACRATLKCEELVDEAKEKLAKIREAKELFEDEPEKYSEEDYKKDLTVAYVQTAVNFVKLYGPAITLGVASIACILGGHHLMRKRNVALIAAYKVMEEGFAAYRKRVVEEYGEETDYMFKNGLRREEYETVTVDDKGKEKITKDIRIVQDPNHLSVYTRIFDETSTEHVNSSEYNKAFLTAQQNYFNNILIARGHVFLNEVYEALGFEHTQMGSIVGWVLKKGGSNYIDFGLYDPKSENNLFINGLERSVILNFNVDGLIYDKI